MTLHRTAATPCDSHHDGLKPDKRSPRAARWAVVAANMAAAALCAVVASCANMGQPDGGWYDETPPRVIHASPADQATDVDANRVRIYFNEYIKLEDASSKIVVSPPQVELPEITTAGKDIKITLKDSLKPNTTYTIDFSDAIIDNNEGNPMGNYTYSFSTGDHIDTLEVSGYVLDASNLEPVKGILVGLQDDLSDSAFTTKPMLRVARTNGSGYFVIKGVAPGDYFAYALQDADNNYIYNQKSEMVAFGRDTIRPRCAPDIRQDTIWRDTLRIDSITRTHYTHFYPDDVTLLAFTAKQTDRYLIKTERQDHRRIGVYFSIGCDTLPTLRGLNFDADSAFTIETSEKLDTVFYWIRDTTLANRDTLLIELTYFATDTAGVLSPVCDTLQEIPRLSYERRMKLQNEEYEDWKKEQEKAKRREQPYDTVMPPKLFTPKFTTPASFSPDRNVFFEVPIPLESIDTAAIHLYSMIDTLWYRSRFQLSQVPGRLRQYIIKAEWRPGVEYSLELDSAALTDIYGSPSKAYKAGLRVRDLDDYSSLAVNITGIADTGIVVQLLNGSDNVVKEVRAENGLTEFYYISPGLYYLRAYVDANGNGEWDTGDYSVPMQAERMYYYPKAVECKLKWDVTITWDFSATPTYRQKPSAITKQKADSSKTIRKRNAERARNLGITYNGQ